MFQFTDTQNAWWSNIFDPPFKSPTTIKHWWHCQYTVPAQQGHKKISTHPTILYRLDSLLVLFLLYREWLGYFYQGLPPLYCRRICQGNFTSSSDVKPGITHITEYVNGERWSHTSFIILYVVPPLQTTQIVPCNPDYIINIQNVSTKRGSPVIRLPAQRGPLGATSRRRCCHKYS